MHEEVKQKNIYDTYLIVKYYKIKGQIRKFMEKNISW